MIEELDFNPDLAKKPCRACDQMLQPCEFYPMRRVCKQCICERNKAAYRNDLDGNREAGRKRYWENPDYREAQKKRSLEVWRQKSNRLEGDGS